MCLTTLKDFEIESKFGYKVMTRHISANGRVHYGGTHRGGRYFAGKWRVASSGRLYTSTFSYKKGFHIWRSISTARTDWKDYGSGPVIVKVEFQNVVATGFNYVSNPIRGKCIIAKRMRIIEEVRQSFTHKGIHRYGYHGIKDVCLAAKGIR
jgi:hypothetical protein